MDFRSDNIAGVHPAIIKNISEANLGPQAPYGQDQYSLKLQKAFSQFFECDISFYFTLTGTASNALALSTICPSYGLVYCQDHAHINVDECGSPEMFTKGGKLMPLSLPNGKIDLEQIHAHQKDHLRPHNAKPTAISITQPTEKGLIYTPQEIQNIAKTAKEYDLFLHMDGARLANALATLQCSPAEITWKSGIDILSFGMTKNGAICAEAIIFFHKNLDKNFDYIQKKSGQLPSKMRYFSAQWLALLTDNIWLENARHANFMAKMMENIFLENKHCIVCYPVETNSIIVKMSKEYAAFLSQKNVLFYPWDNGTYRFMTSFQTSEQDIELFKNILEEYEYNR